MLRVLFNRKKTPMFFNQIVEAWLVLENNYLMVAVVVAEVAVAEVAEMFLDPILPAEQRVTRLRALSKHS